jgi:Uri superfamily endonuclease
MRMTVNQTRRSRRSVVFAPPDDHWPDSGVYRLWIRVSVELCVTVGRLGRLEIPAGLYVYTGRASRGLRARVRRHVRGAACKHWHIDYLLAGRGVRLERVELVSNDPGDECPANQAVGRKGGCPVHGFGASDCRAKCPAHLWRVG